MRNLSVEQGTRGAQTHTVAVTFAAACGFNGGALKPGPGSLLK